VLAQNLDNMGFYPVTHAVFSMLGDKDIAGVIAHVRARIDRWHVAPLAGPRGTSAESIAQALRAVGADSVAVYDSVATAYAHAHKAAGADDRIVVFGSFITVAEAMRVIAQRR
jgi:dihydrofolate synthase/folylpolyglutamate synthase